MKMEKNHILSSSLTNYLHASASMSCCNLAAPRLMPWFASTISQLTPHCLPAFFSGQPYVDGSRLICARDSAVHHRGAEQTVLCWSSRAINDCGIGFVQFARHHRYL